MIEEQAKIFLDSDGAILPEFEGYAYTNEGGKSTVDFLQTSKPRQKDIFCLYG